MRSAFPPLIFTVSDFIASRMQIIFMLLPLRYVFFVAQTPYPAVVALSHYRLPSGCMETLFILLKFLIVRFPVTETLYPPMA